jgi:hypothetical protein
MNKEQTHKEIKRLIRIYEKRLLTCSEQWDELNEGEREFSDDNMVEIMNGLVTEINLMQEFVDDLNMLLGEDGEN